MHNLLKILIFTLRNFTKLPILRYLGICNILYIWHIRAIPTYRVYRLYDGVENDTSTVGDDDDDDILYVYSKELTMSSNTSGSEVWTGMLYCKES